MERNVLEIAIVATELNGIMEKIARRSTPQLRAMLRESKTRHGELSASYAEMRKLIVRVGGLFADYVDDEPVTPEPGARSLWAPDAPAVRHAQQDFT
jgi:hypothetical protein